MTSIEEHKKKIKEHLEELDDAINHGITDRPITIGFHCSACAIQMLGLYLHCTNKISVGSVVKHDWFKRPKIEQKKEPLVDRKLKIIFPKKEEIYALIYTIEENRNNLLYGKPAISEIEGMIESFNQLKRIMLIELEKENVKI